MDPHVEEADEGCVAAPHPLDSRPSSERHDAVVDHVEGGQVGELSSQQEQEGVYEVNVL